MENEYRLVWEIVGIVWKSSVLKYKISAQSCKSCLIAAGDLRNPILRFLNYLKTSS